MSDETTPTQEPPVAKLAALPLDDDQPPVDTNAPPPPAPKPRTLESLLAPEETKSDVPPWAKLPPGLRFPRGRQVIFMRLRAEWTDTPAKGERQCILWPLSVGDKKLAISRSQGDVLRFPDEIAKQVIRVIDGVEVDWTGTPGAGNVDTFWEEIGERGRTMIQRIHTKLHTLDQAENRDFFENCIAVRSTG